MPLQERRRLLVLMLGLHLLRVLLLRRHGWMLTVLVRWGRPAAPLLLLLLHPPCRCRR